MFGPLAWKTWKVEEDQRWSVFSSGKRSLKIQAYTNHESVAANCHLSLHACNRLLFARRLSIDSRAYAISQHARWPIRTPCPTCTNQDAWAVITPKRAKANSIHTAAWHAWTRTPPLNIVQKAVFSIIHFPASFICLWPSCHFDLRGSRHGWGFFVDQTAPYKIIFSLSGINRGLVTVIPVQWIFRPRVKLYHLQNARGNVVPRAIKKRLTVIDEHLLI